CSMNSRLVGSLFVDILTVKKFIVQARMLAQQKFYKLPACSKKKVQARMLAQQNHFLSNI
ncbi:MAG: hypothetical protein M0Q94_04040, partial [Candidatus Cloacimonetes bacterium]|nr:hypothetical protein [Candidatus Cloacimonadota bacterium]